ncbi:MAG: hypothetical protein R8K50_03815 [Mariprofundus sp.]
MVYKCFNYISLFFIVVGILAVLPLDNATYQVLAMVLGIPAALIFAAAGVFGVGATLVCSREWPQLVMSASFIGLGGVFAISENITVAQSEQYSIVLSVISSIAIFLIISLSARYFYLKMKSKE